MGERLARFLEAVGRLTAAEAGYSEQHYPRRVTRPNMGDDLVWACCDSTIGQPCAHKRAARQAARELHDAMTERPGQ